MDPDTHQIMTQVYQAKKDNAAADELIAAYMPFIKSETSKFINRPPDQSDDELSIAMFAFYATSFDSITMVASNYSYKNIKDDEMASKKMKLFWAVLLIMLPIALIFSEGTMANLQTVSIIAAFPIGIVMVLIVASFIKDAKKYLREEKKE